MDEDVRTMTPEEMDTKVREMVTESSGRVFLQHRRLEPGIQVQIDGDNQKAGRKKWDYDHLMEGFHCAQAPSYVEGTTPVLEQDAAIAMWGYTRYHVRSEMKRKGILRPGRTAPLAPRVRIFGPCPGRRAGLGLHTPPTRCFLRVGRRVQTACRFEGHRNDSHAVMGPCGRGSMEGRVSMEAD
jgi:hypothetical protein